MEGDLRKTCRECVNRKYLHFSSSQADLYLGKGEKHCHKGLSTELESSQMSSSGGSLSILEDNPARNKQLFISVLCLPPLFKCSTNIYS